MEEIYVYHFGEQFLNDYKYILNQIISYIQNCKDIFSLSKYNLDFKDIDERIADSSHLRDKSISFMENGIEILVPLTEFWDDIKDYIPRTVTRLEIPYKYIRDNIEFLTEFPNLENFVITDFGKLSIEELKYINEKTSIKKILAKNVYDVDDYVSNDKGGVIEYPYNYLIYGDLIYCSSDKLDIDEYLSRSLFHNAKIHVYDFDRELIERLYAVIDERLKDKIEIDCRDNSYCIEFEENKSICTIKVKSNNPSAINKIYNYLSFKGIKVSKIVWELLDDNYYSLDLSSLVDIANKTELFINYDKYINSCFEDFKGLLESVKWYRQIIIDSNLSPVEKIMFAVDIVKTFKYNEGKESMDSRMAHRIIETGNIVCVGYSSMLEQILRHLDDGIKIEEFGLDCYDKNGEFKGGHSRVLFKIDDDKYNIHGIYTVDATWDSDKSHVVDFDFLPGYTSLDLYRYFLIPAAEYETVFPGDTLPDLFKCYLGRKYNDWGFKEQYENLFGKEYGGNFLDSNKNVDNANKSGESMVDVLALINNMKKDKEENGVSSEEIDAELKRYLSAVRPSMAMFTEMLVNVRLAEGYKREDIFNEVTKVVDINKKVIQKMNADGDNIEFFVEEKGVIR